MFWYLWRAGSDLHLCRTVTTSLAGPDIEKGRETTLSDLKFLRDNNTDKNSRALVCIAKKLAKSSPFHEYFSA